MNIPYRSKDNSVNHLRNEYPKYTQPREKYRNEMAFNFYSSFMHFLFLAYNMHGLKIKETKSWLIVNSDTTEN